MSMLRIQTLLKPSCLTMRYLRVKLNKPGSLSAKRPRIKVRHEELVYVHSGLLLSHKKE